MKKILSFVKLSERWFIDIPWEGDVSDLQMVAGADLLLDSLCNGNARVSVEVSTDLIKDNIHLNRVSEDELGATYGVDTLNFSGEIWLCPVTLAVFPAYPKDLYIKVL